MGQAGESQANFGGILYHEKGGQVVGRKGDLWWNFGERPSEGSGAFPVILVERVIDELGLEGGGCTITWTKDLLTWSRKVDNAGGEG